MANAEFTKEDAARLLREDDVHVIPIGGAEPYAVVLARGADAERVLKRLRLPEAERRKVKALQEQNSALIQQIDEMRVINRAKLILVSHLGLAEPAAHKYIEKRAMDSRATKREVAEAILKTYEN